jgi:hypothetical protein
MSAVRMSMVFRRFFQEWTFEAGSGMKKGPVGALSTGVAAEDGTVWGTQTTSPSKALGGIYMDEKVVVAAFSNIVPALANLATAALDLEDPFAFPEPPSAMEIATYAAQITALKEQIAKSYHPRLDASLRDYQAGFFDRAAVYLVEVLEALQAEPTYAQTFSPATQKQLGSSLQEIKNACA